jgi:hypothetical protein
VTGCDHNYISHYDLTQQNSELMTQWLYDICTDFCFYVSVLETHSGCHSHITAHIKLLETCEHGLLTTTQSSAMISKWVTLVACLTAVS